MECGFQVAGGHSSVYFVKHLIPKLKPTTFSQGSNVNHGPKWNTLVFQVEIFSQSRISTCTYLQARLIYGMEKLNTFLYLIFDRISTWKFHATLMGKLHSINGIFQHDCDKICKKIWRNSRTILTEMATYVDELVHITGLQVVKYASVVEIGQVSHIFYFLVLRRVHLLDVILLHRAVLKIK